MAKVARVAELGLVIANVAIIADLGMVMKDLGELGELRGRILQPIVFHG